LKQRHKDKRLNILFLNLTAFSRIGGIEKFNKCLMLALRKMEEADFCRCSSYSLYDDFVDERYFKKETYLGFKGNKIKFIVNSLLSFRKFNVIIIGHIHLAVLLLWIKSFSRSTKKIVVVVHGVEVARKLSKVQAWAIKRADKIIAVSSYTRSLILKNSSAAAETIAILPNTVDPYFSQQALLPTTLNLRNRYSLEKDDFVLFTLARLSSKEQYKGYDKVIAAMAGLIDVYPKLKYVIAGKYDEIELKRLLNLVDTLSLKEKVFFVGYVDENEIAAHYKMADVFIMPSSKEGFGIVFLEALLCGTPVIGGNADGTVDALNKGCWGMLVDSSSVNSIEKAIVYSINNYSLLKAKGEWYKKEVEAKFGFQEFSNQWQKLLHQII